MASMNGGNAGRTIHLSRNVDVRVVPVPPYAANAIRATIPLPKPPVIMVDSVAGHQEPWANADDPAYKAALKEAEAARATAINEYTIVMALPDVVPPDDEEWFAALAQFGVQHRAGALGRKLDYIQYYLLATNADWELVWKTVADLTYVKEERIAALEETFRDHGGRQTAE
jgi:hypothetical protein